jgi:alkaline phosphatase
MPFKPLSTGPRSPRPLSAARLWAALALIGCLVATAAIGDVSAGGPSAAQLANTARLPKSGQRIVAVGDVACRPNKPQTLGSCHQVQTARAAYQQNPSRVLLLGDIQYDNGALADYRASFAKAWAGMRKQWRPAPGNHEYNTPGAAGYYSFFGGRAGRGERGNYSFDVGAWHLIALNSNCAIVGCGDNSAQVRWLRADLKRHKNRCVGAYWHHPRYSSGTHGDDPEVAPLWRELRKAGAEFVLSGHDHSYQRFAPQDENHRLAPRTGIRQFVAGTGGEDHTAIARHSANSEKAIADQFGVIVMDLRAKSYDWRFVNEAGKSLDRGSDRCH